MCTLTIIPNKNKDFVLTQNRDEAPYRIALAPNFYDIENTRLLFPKDEASGGTWIGISEKNRVVCILNGGFKLHQRKSNYRKSRGIVANDFMIADDIVKTIDAYDFFDIEPFTTVIVDWNLDLALYELVWDGSYKHFARLPLEPKIWSSSTLYTEAMKQVRRDWFDVFKSEHHLDADALLNFHKTAGQGNTDYGVVMDRGFVKTTSITQVKKQNNMLYMHYETINTKVTETKMFNIAQVLNE